MPHDETDALDTAEGLDDTGHTVLGIVIVACFTIAGFILGAWLM